MVALEGKESDDLGYQSLKMSTLVEKSRLLGKAFYLIGLREGDYGSLYLPNTTEYHCLALGVWLCGAIVSPGDPSMTARGMGFQLDEVRPKVVVCHLGNLQTVQQALRQSGLLGMTRIVVVALHQKLEEKENVYGYADLLERATTLPPLRSDLLTTPREPDDVIVIIWSSGTTGRPKGIQMVNRQLQSWLRPGVLPVTELLTTTCFFHGGGFIYPLSYIVADCSACFFPVECLESEDCSRLMFRSIDLLKPRGLIGGSHHVMRLCNSSEPTSKGLDLSSLNFASAMGAAIAHDADELLKRHFPNFRYVVNFYGMSEFGNLIAMSFTPKHLGHVGQGTEVKIVDPDTGTICGPNEVGEIMAKCHRTMKGYLNRPEETAKFFAKDGFVHTGDMGHYDEEGILYYDSRLKEMIKYQNIHIHPLEVEEVIGQHPGILEVGVFGKAHPEDQEHVAAAIVKKEDSEVTDEDVKGLVEKTLEKSKWLRGGVHFVQSLPRNPHGKLQRKQLEKMFA